MNKEIMIPNLKKIINSARVHKPGYGISTKTNEFVKQSVWEQATTPEDKNILRKLEIKKGEKILVIAGYYASWASALQEAGAILDYSDVSKSLVNYAKNKIKTKFHKYICSAYEIIPRIENEYDWTFTFEACGSKLGLPLAYLRSLLNRKGGILILYWRDKKPENMGSKPKAYPRIIKTLAKIYNTKYKIKKVIIKGHGKATAKTLLKHIIYFLYTNSKAREKAKSDLIALEKNKFSKENLSRLNKLSKIIKKEFLKKLKINSIYA